jgi:hypothetical protein
MDCRENNRALPWKRQYEQEQRLGMNRVSWEEHRNWPDRNRTFMVGKSEQVVWEIQATSWKRTLEIQTMKGHTNGS